MFQRITFYINHALNDLRVNGQRTLFALLCIAAGVAAIVSLQNLGFMAEKTLTDNLQQQNRGDLRLSNLFGQWEDPGDYQQLQGRLDQQFPGLTEVTYNIGLEDLGDIFLGADGTVIVNPETGRQESQLSPIFIDPAIYPFYDTVESQDGLTLAEMILEPTDLVISEEPARALDLKVGDEVRVRGSEAAFRVAGIVDTEEEISGFQDIFLGIFGYFYLDDDALDYFGEELEVIQRAMYVKVNDTERVGEVERAVNQITRNADISTIEDLLELNQEIADQLNTAVTMMGLLALLLGCIGIINTMQVVVRRRTLEIAVLKTIGLRANQITLLFLTEALIMGIIGSIAGVILGSAATFLIRDVAKSLVGGREVAFSLALTPVINGLVVGTLITTVFGFLPTLSAGQVRPALVLRPSERVILRAGWIRSILVLFGSMVVLAVIVQSIIEEAPFWMALAGVAAAFVIAGLLYLLLWVMIWVVGRLTPTFGLPDLRISRQQILSAKPRGAITLLALVVGVFALSTITFFAQSFTNLLDAVIEAAGTETVWVQTFNDGQLSQIETVIQETEEVQSYTVMRMFNTRLDEIQYADGNTLSDFFEFDNFREQMGLLRGFNEEELRDQDFIAGGQVTAPGQIVIRDSTVRQDLNIQVGDTLRFEFFGGNRLTMIELEIVGITRAPGSSPIVDVFGDNRFLISTLEGTGVESESVGYTVSMPEDDVWKLSQAINEATAFSFVFDLRLISNVIEALIDEFDAFPTLVAILGLIVGGVVIANSVALSTMERRREIAVMKAVGLRRERVLGMLLVENALLGLVGGLIGAGIGIAVLTGISAYFDLPLDTVPYATGFGLMALCIVVAIVAALTTAWGASGEKPLNVLRYE